MTVSVLDKIGDLDAFRQAVCDWLAEVNPKGWAERMATATAAEFEAFERWWMAERNKVGLATPHWPKAYGGADLSLKHQAILAEEISRAGAPNAKLYVIALNHIPATLISWGTEAQKTKYLPGVSQGVVWCQGFSEPGAGSDLASLTCRAVRDGDDFVINGQKIWSSYSMFADYCILLARTSSGAKKQEGITYFILDMKAPGVEVRPIRQSTGHAEFAELFLTDVRIPAEDVVGAVDQGWAVAQATLASERGLLAFERQERQRYVFENVYRDAVRTDADWLKDDGLRREYLTLFGEMQAGRRMVRQVLKEPHEQASFSLLPPLVKLTGSVLWQKYNALRLRLDGVDSQVFQPSELDTTFDPMMEYVGSFGGTIAAGTNEVMRNIIAERGLGMPRG